MLKEHYKVYEEKMKKSVEAVERDFGAVRAGRANASVLNRIQVDYYGTPTPINQMGNISAPEPRLLVIAPYDPSALKEIEKALQKSDLGINPSNDGKVIRLVFPELTEERRRDLVKVVIPRVFAGNTLALDDPQVCFEGGDLVMRPAGKVCKRCAWAPQGRVELRWPERGLTFAKTVQVQPFGRYPLDGCNVAVFAGEGNWMAELETYGPEQPILPGQTVEHTEIWELIS